MNTLIRPWLSPKMSQSMIGVMNGLGHNVQYGRGEEIYTSPNLFERLMFVRSGVVVKALQDPVRSEPLMLSLSCAGAMCGSFENLYVRDRLPRRHYCLTNAELLVINQELLLKIADQNILWQRELANYSSHCALCDRLGMVANRFGSVEERLGALLVLLQVEGNGEVEQRLTSSGIEWIAINTIPSLRTISLVLDTDISSLYAVVRQWIASNALRKRAGRYWFKRSVFFDYRDWLHNIVRRNI